MKPKRSRLWRFHRRQSGGTTKTSWLLAGQNSPSPDLLEADHAFVAHVDGHRAGFYTLEHLDDEEVELGFLSVEPGMQRLGIGRQLVDHAGSTASDLGYWRLVIVGDPHAEDFYRAMGAVAVGTTPSVSIPGRHLTVVHLSLPR
ncbi:MAG: GNAT family N-acetyltransferase [Candidatus Latescibacterota bacterium]